MRGFSQRKIDKTVALLVARGAKEVYLLGSVARGATRRGSDVDFAVSGIPARVFFRALGEAREQLGQPVDLIDLDEDTEFTRLIRSHGEMIRVA